MRLHKDQKAKKKSDIINGIKSGCKMVFIDPDHDMMQIVFWKAKDRIKITKYYTDFNNYDFTPVSYTHLTLPTT